MTDRQTIKLELAKAALKNNAFSDAAELNESIKSLYDWITDEPEVVIEATPDFRSDPIDKLIKAINKYGRSGGYGVRISNALHDNHIATIGELVEAGRRDVGNMYHIGEGALRRIDDTLKELYGLTSW